MILSACSNAPTVQTATATRKQFVVPILADGTLEPLPGGEVRAPEAAVIGALLVHEGQRVTRGTELIRLDNPDLTQRVLQSRSDSQQLAASAAEAKQQGEQLHAIADADARLVKSGAITNFEYQQAVEKARAADAQLADLTQRKQLADDAARDLQARATQMVLRAPADGLVYNLSRTGESVMPGQVLATVSDPLHMRVRARVDAPDVPRVHAGQHFTVTFEGLPNQKWQGAIIEVPPGLRQVGPREVGEVIGEINGDASALPANASVTVEIVVGEKIDALVIPRGALMRDDETRFVYQYAAGKAVRTPIQIGLIGPTEVEIVSGLREGDTVILPGGTMLHDGEAVKVGG
ncbi:MAG TPA: efflux RND transporter periplasmic adaptor subunit [Thermoanaerobaculia bacterium]|nr:efflux RND transporter periplasmic adaptor subunit [Thermoanaerobaculia bacterium]